MKRNKRRGRKTMMFGLLLIAASMALTAYNLTEQKEADDASSAVLTQMEIPSAASTVEEEASSLMLSDEAGRAVNWPLDQQGVPIPWPVEDGHPVPVVTDGHGTQHAWKDVLVQEPSDEADPVSGIETAVHPAPETEAWTTDESGAILPWIRDEEGQTIPWPTDSDGVALDWSEIREKWKEIVLQLLPYQIYVDDEEEPLFVSHPNVEMPTQEIDGNSYIGVLEIPKFELSLPVMSEWSYPKFKKAPCRYVGSAYTGNLIIAAHNYDRHFGKIKTLELGDLVRFTDVEGNVFNYAVSGFETLGKKDVEQMEAGEWDLTLFTCTPGGAKRVTVRCVQRSYLWQKQ